ncbi:hypothetical protein ACHQM5_027733 [Ranunculus cassubicifolius]
MDPGCVPLELSRLSDLEKMLIARVHPMMSVYRVRGQQYKYSGNVINFAQDVNEIAEKLPYKPEDLTAILVVNKSGLRSSKEFRVRREFVRQALVWLKLHNPHYRNLEIADGALSALPIDGTPDIPNITEQDGNREEYYTVNPIQLNDPSQQHDTNYVPLHIEDFEATGTILAPPQPNQRHCIQKALHVPDVDRTTTNMHFSNMVINEFKTVGYMSSMSLKKLSKLKLGNYYFKLIIPKISNIRLVQ